MDDEEKGCVESDASLVENLRTFAGSRATRDQWASRKRTRIMREALLVPNCTSTFLARTVTGESRDMLDAAFYQVLYCLYARRRRDTLNTVV